LPLRGPLAGECLFSGGGGKEGSLNMGAIKKFFLISIMSLLISFLFIGHSWAMKATTVKNMCACFTRGDVEDMMSFVASDDRASFAAYMIAGKCITLRGGIDVTVTKSPGVFGAYSEFVFQGLKMWTVREGLENYR